MRRFRRLAGAPGLLLLVSIPVALPADAVVHDLVFRHVVSHELRLLANGVTQLGSTWAAVGLLGSLAVIGHRAADAGLLRASLGGLVGVGAGSLAAQVVKQATCRARPRLLDGWGVDAAEPRGRPVADGTALGFFHWPCLTDSRYHSFPSGHAVTAFAVAAALSCALPARRRTWLAVSGGVGASRVLLNAHFLSDVLGGALLGWLAGRAGQGLAGRLAAIARPSPAVEAPGRAGTGSG